MKAETILNHCAKRLGVTPESILLDIEDEKNKGSIWEQIETIVSSEMGLEISEIKRRTRSRNISTSRQLCIYLCRKHLVKLTYQWDKKEKENQLVEIPESYAQIGARYGLDHSTVIYAIKCIKDISEGKDKYTDVVNKIIQSVEKQLKENQYMEVQQISKPNFLQRIRLFVGELMKPCVKQKSANGSDKVKLHTKPNGEPLVKIIGIKSHEKTKDVHFIITRNKEIETKGHITTPIGMKNKECRAQILKSVNQAKV